jgi:proton glutamate symport protein
VASFGLPLEGVAILLGVDAVLDMARTSLNLVGNCLATAVMARWEGEFERIDALAAFERKPALAGVEQEG